MANHHPTPDRSGSLYGEKSEPLVLPPIVRGNSRAQVALTTAAVTVAVQRRRRNNVMVILDDPLRGSIEVMRRRRRKECRVVLADGMLVCEDCCPGWANHPAVRQGATAVCIRCNAEVDVVE